MWTHGAMWCTYRNSAESRPKHPERSSQGQLLAILVPYGTLKSGSSIFFSVGEASRFQICQVRFFSTIDREVKLGVKATGKDALPTRPTFMGIHPQVTESILDRSDVEGGPLTPKHH